MRVLLVTLGVFLSISSFAQTLPAILQTDKPARGIYMDFNEFIDNKPSVNIDFELKPRSKSKQFLLGGSDYDLVPKDGKTTTWEAKKFWGVSTGDSIFVNVSNYETNKGYIKLDKLGRYCYLKGRTSLNTQVAGTGGLVGAVPYEAAFVLNINNGNFYMLTISIMKKILQRDAELYRQYDAEKRRQQNNPDVMLSYVDQYNIRHPEEIGKKEKIPELIIYRREKKERAETVSILTADSVQLDMVPGDFKTLYGKDYVTLCLSGRCSDYRLSPDGITYLECTFRPDDFKPMLERREKKAGEFYLREIRFIQETRKE